MKIQGIYFDMDDVLYNCAEFSTTAREAGLQSIKSYYPRLEMVKLKDDANTILSDKGRNHSRFFNDILEVNEIQPNDPDYYLAVANAIKEYHDRKYSRELEPFPYTNAKLSKLLDNGIKIGILSNGDPIKQCDKIIRLGLEPFFESEYIIISGAVGYEKPEPEIYLLGAERMKIEPQHIAFCDDRIDNVNGAMNVGMTGIHMLHGKHSKKTGKPDISVNDISQIYDKIV